MINRRSLITGLISLAAAPAIVRASSLMPVKVVTPTILRYDFYFHRVNVLYGIMKLKEYSYDPNTFDGPIFTPIYNFPKLD